MKIRGIIVLVVIFLSGAALSFAAGNETAVQSENKTGAAATATPGLKKIFTKIGVVEAKEGEKLKLKRKTASLEYYVNSDTQVFAKDQASAKDITEKNYILIKGPNNKNAILASTVYIFPTKKEFEEYASAEMQADLEIKRFDLFTRATVIKSTGEFDKVAEYMRPVLVDVEGNSKMIMAYDEDTYFVKVSKADQSILTVGERVTLYFADMINIRVKNYTFRVLVNKAKPGY
jgi:hypothetical protein